MLAGHATAIQKFVDGTLTIPPRVLGGLTESAHMTDCACVRVSLCVRRPRH